MDKLITAEMVAGCEREDLRHSGAIMSHGALLHVSAEGQLITHVSENIAEFCGLTPQQVLDKPLAQSGIAIQLDPNDLRRQPGSRNEHAHLHGAAGTLCVLVTVVKTGWLVEMLPAPVPGAGSDKARTVGYQQIKLDQPLNEEEIVSFAGILTSGSREVTGFDRVMVYRFEDDWSGTVIGESIAPGQEGFLGLRFPASDIPQIARDLYRVTPYRQIPDSSATTVSIVSTGDEKLDLSFADLRSVSPLHIQYLKNMGVASSFSISIIVQESLWGLLAFHSMRPALLSQETIGHLRRMVRDYEVGVANVTTTRRLAVISGIQRMLDELSGGIDTAADWDGALAQEGERLAALIQCKAGAVVLGGKIRPFGRNPPDKGVMGSIDQWFAAKCPDPLFMTDKLSGSLTEAAGFAAQVSGLVAMKVRGARLYWYRPELIQQVEWAGNPEKTAEGSDDAMVLSPRKSFEKWVQIKQGFSESWRNENRMAAKKIMTSLQTWPSLQS